MTCPICNQKIDPSDHSEKWGPEFAHSRCVIAFTAGSAIQDAKLQDRIKHLRDGIAKQNQTIEQACGKVLGYPWFKDDQKNFPGATEKDGVCVGEHVAETIVSELAKRHTEVLARINRLEREVELLRLYGNKDCTAQADEVLKKEAKP